MLQDIINEIEESRSLEPLTKLKKQNLVQVTAHFGINPAVSGTKSPKQNLVLIEDHSIENNIIDEVEEKPIADTAEVVRLKLDFECEEWRLAHEEAQKACDAKKVLQDAQLAEAREAHEAVEGEAQKACEAA